MLYTFAIPVAGKCLMEAWYKCSYTTYHTSHTQSTFPHPHPRLHHICTIRTANSTFIEIVIVHVCAPLFCSPSCSTSSIVYSPGPSWLAVLQAFKKPTADDLGLLLPIPCRSILAGCSGSLLGDWRQMTLAYSSPLQVHRGWLSWNPSGSRSFVADCPAWKHLGIRAYSSPHSPSWLTTFWGTGDRQPELTPVVADCLGSPASRNWRQQTTIAWHWLRRSICMLGKSTINLLANYRCTLGQTLSFTVAQGYVRRYTGLLNYSAPDLICHILISVLFIVFWRSMKVKVSFE